MSANRLTPRRPGGFGPGCASALLALVVIVLPWGAARADEGGVAYGFSGQYASLAAVPATPGWFLPVQGFFYDGSASGSRSFNRGISVEGGLKSRTLLILTQPTYAPETKVLGGQMALGVGFGYGTQTT